MPKSKADFSVWLDKELVKEGLYYGSLVECDVVGGACIVVPVSVGNTSNL